MPQMKLGFYFVLNKNRIFFLLRGKQDGENLAGQFSRKNCVSLQIIKNPNFFLPILNIAITMNEPRRRSSLPSTSVSFHLAIVSGMVMHPETQVMAS